MGSNIFRNVFDDLDIGRVQDPLFSALECAYHILSHQEYTWKGLNSGTRDYQSVISTWQEFADRSPYCRMALEFLRRFEEEVETKRVAQEAMVLRRKEIANNYDAIFIAIGRRDGFYCKNCGLSPQNLQVDHVIPLSKGGTNDPDNLQLLCKTCNISKGDRV